MAKQSSERVQSNLWVLQSLLPETPCTGLYDPFIPIQAPQRPGKELRTQCAWLLVTSVYSKCLANQEEEFVVIAKICRSF